MVAVERSRAPQVVIRKRFHLMVTNGAVGEAMTRTTTTVMLKSAECAARSAPIIEKVLRDLPGVLRAKVNPVTEAVYVEFDGDRCSEADISNAIEALDIITPDSAITRGGRVPRFPLRS